MGLPRYIVNYSDILPYLKTAISQAQLSVSASGLDLSNVTDAVLDTEAIAGKISSIIDINTVVNQTWDEISLSLEDGSIMLSAMREQKAEELTEFGKLLTDYYAKTKETREIVEKIADQLVPFGQQGIQGFYRYVPAGRGDYTVEFTPDDEIFLTAITYSQIGWKFEDTFSLFIGDVEFFKNVSTKEVAEKKSFSKYQKVPANTPVKFVLHNNSGNSRQMWLDVEYLVEES